MNIPIGEVGTNAIVSKYKQKLDALLIKHQAVSVLRDKNSRRHMIMMVELCQQVEDKIRQHEE